jgi:hypothetical protein
MHQSGPNFARAMIHLEGQVPYELQRLIEVELSGDERVVWSAQPIASHFARKGLPSVWFGIPWTAFAIFWTVAAGWGTWKKGNFGWWLLFPAFGLPFILIGFGLLLSPFWMRRRAARTLYALTNRRALIVTLGRRGHVTVRSFEPERLMDLQRNQNADNSGDVVFTQDVGYRGDRAKNVLDVGFLAIHDVKRVEEMVRKLVAENRRDAG